jgi:hypothetical protein
MKLFSVKENKVQNLLKHCQPRNYLKKKSKVRNMLITAVKGHKDDIFWLEMRIKTLCLTG